METRRHRISIREMEMILAVLTSGTMAKAALQLNISQPAISRMVKHAEERTGLQLFERRGTRLIPTSDLNTLSAEFERVFNSVDRVQGLAMALSAGLGRAVHVSTMSVFATTLLTPAFLDLRETHPRTPMAVKLNHRSGVERDIISEEFDIGLVHGVFHHESLTAVPLCTAHVVCLMQRTHPLAARSEIGPRDLADVDLVSMGRNSPLSRQVMDAFEAAGVERRIVIQIADSGLAAHFCASGLGLALLDPFFISAAPSEDLVIRPFVPEIQTECFAIYSNRRVLPELEADLVRRLEAAGAAWERSFRDLLTA
jgi:DNA-binding transcriptional LysR family regulator